MVRILPRVKANQNKVNVTSEQDKRVDLAHKVARIKTRPAVHNKAANKVSAADNRARDKVMTAVQAVGTREVPAWDQDKEKTIYNMPIDLPNKSLRSPRT